jgi:GrpB-like predicted nucleotidyltransferase (UPF0157 family)
VQEKQITALMRPGYEYLDEAGVSGRLASRKRHPKAFDIAAVEWDGRLRRENLLLRNFLLANPKESRRYEQDKRKLVTQGVSSFLQYSERKEALAAELPRRAEARAGRGFS